MNDEQETPIYMRKQFWATVAAALIAVLGYFGYSVVMDGDGVRMDKVQEESPADPVIELPETDPSDADPKVVEDGADQAAGEILADLPVVEETPAIPEVVSEVQAEAVEVQSEVVQTYPVDTGVVIQEQESVVETPEQ